MRTMLTVCVCTYRRTTLLRRLLESLAAQVDLDHSRLRVVVVDNDADGSAQGVVAMFEEQLRNTHYVIEKRRNIAAARNTAIAHSAGEYIAFIDDDERATETWLERLISRAEETGAACVFGPVLAEFPKNSPSWIERGAFFTRNGPGTNALVDWREARTGNALIRRDLFTQAGYRFDEQYGLSGGEDAALFKSMHAGGLVFAWAAGAVVHEWTEQDRLNFEL